MTKRIGKNGKNESHYIDKTTYKIGNNFSASETSPLQVEMLPNTMVKCSNYVNRECLNIELRCAISLIVTVI